MLSVVVNDHGKAVRMPRDATDGRDPVSIPAVMVSQGDERAIERLFRAHAHSPPQVRPRPPPLPWGMPNGLSVQSLCHVAMNWEMNGLCIDIPANSRTFLEHSCHVTRGKYRTESTLSGATWGLRSCPDPVRCESRAIVWLWLWMSES